MQYISHSFIFSSIAIGICLFLAGADIVEANNYVFTRLPHHLSDQILRQLNIQETAALASVSREFRRHSEIRKRLTIEKQVYYGCHSSVYSNLKLQLKEGPDEFIQVNIKDYMMHSDCLKGLFNMLEYYSVRHLALALMDTRQDPDIVVEHLQTLSNLQSFALIIKGKLYDDIFFHSLAETLKRMKQIEWFMLDISDDGFLSMGTHSNVFRSLGNAPNLKELAISYEQTADIHHSRQLNFMLSSMKYLEVLKLDMIGNNIDVESTYNLFSSIGKLQKLRALSISLYMNEPNSYDLVHLAESLKELCGLSILELDISCDGCNSYSYLELAKSIGNIARLEKLDIKLHYDILVPVVAGALRISLKQLTNLESFSLKLEKSFSGHNVHNLIYLFNGLRNAHELKAVNLKFRYIAIEDEALKDIMDSIRNFASLERLELDILQNHLTSQTKWYIASVLSGLSTLTYLKFDLFEIGEIVSQRLQSPKMHLETLVVAVKSTPNTALDFFRAIGKMPSLKRVNMLLENKAINFHSLSELKDSLSKLENLVSLSLVFDDITDTNLDLFYACSVFLRQLHRLRKLHLVLPAFRVNQKTVQHFAYALSQLKNVESIHVDIQRVDNIGNYQIMLIGNAIALIPKSTKVEFKSKIFTARNKNSLQGLVGDGFQLEPVDELETQSDSPGLLDCFIQ